MKKLLVLPAIAAVIMSSCAGNPEGKKAEVQDSVATEQIATPAGEVFNVDATQSKVVWTGTKVTGAHTGTIAIKSGSLNVNNGVLTGGTFTLDLNTISSTDLEGEYKEKLDGHLKAADFFDVAKFPEATFVVTKAEAGATAQDVKISGNLTIKGITKNISFDAKVIESTATTIKTEADFNIVRADWGVSYEGKKDDLISAEINFKVSLVATK
ncbi:MULTISPECIES: YceI family protein [unclassified Sphingobacterium]|uniref:YceI family protein n=1 Tax=unclassified Sphingobacterium TaxID=2609468 RepID=UPI00143A8F11|nr:YceI family protein [Sphingobacterium sp. B16(2022)]NJI71701.1 YceI family protein [Sphingobacterium sp. B16(2022)]